MLSDMPGSACDASRCSSDERVGGIRQGAHLGWRWSWYWFLLAQRAPTTPILTTHASQDPYLPTWQMAPLWQGRGYVYKRGLDLVVALALAVLLAPLMALVAALVKLTSVGPAFFCQERVGLFGRSFIMWKFRTMTVDAERQTGPVWAQPGDPRVTPLGRWLRRTSLDELPQLWNVLRGDMSLVGPRPERPMFVDLFSRRLPAYPRRHWTPPGITGWAQVNGHRGATDLGPRLDADLDYIARWSVWFDCEILLRTVLAVARQTNAH